MSQISDDFLNALKPFFEENGYKFIKSKTSFRKKVNDYTLNIHFKFDGSGGLVLLNRINYQILNLEKEILFGGAIHYENLESGKIEIPIFYSRKASDLLTLMNLKDLGNLNYEEKYPEKLVKDCLEKIKNLMTERVFPFFENPL